MSNQAQEGVLLLVVAAALAVLWLRGYLTAWLDTVTAAIGAPPVKQPFAFPGSGSPSGAPIAVRRAM